MMLTDCDRCGIEKVETVKKLVRSYFNVVRKQMMDYVPKTCMAFLVRGIIADIQGELVSALYSDSSVVSALFTCSAADVGHQAYQVACE